MLAPVVDLVSLLWVASCRRASFRRSLSKLAYAVPGLVSEQSDTVLGYAQSSERTIPHFLRRKIDIGSSALKADARKTICSGDRVIAGQRSLLTCCVVRLTTVIFVQCATISCTYSDTTPVHNTVVAGPHTRVLRFRRRRSRRSVNSFAIRIL